MFRRIVLFIFNSKFLRVCYKVSKVYVVDAIRIAKQSTYFKDENLWNKMNRMVSRNLKASRQLIEKQTKDKFKNGEEYGRLIETTFQNLMLNKWLLRIEERFARNRSFLPQEMVQQDVWTRGLQKRHHSRWRFQWGEM